MPNLQDNYNELLGMLTIHNEDIKKKVLALVKEALPGATEIEFCNIYHDDHPQLSLEHDVCAACRAVVMFLGQTFSIRFGGWPNPMLGMNNTPEVAVKLMTDLPDVIGKDILHLDSKAAKHLGGRFVSDKYESRLENGESLLIMHGTLTGVDTPLPLASLVLTVHEGDLDHADIEVVYKGKTVTKMKGTGVFHDDWIREIDDAMEHYFSQENEEPVEAEEAVPVECSTWTEFWDYVSDEKSETQAVLRNFGSLISEHTDGEPCDDLMNRKVYFKYKGIDFSANIETDDLFDSWFFHIEATDGVRDAGFHNFNRGDDFVKFMDLIVETRQPEPVKEPEEDICKGIFDNIDGLDDDSDLECTYAGCETRRLIDKFFKTYFLSATVKSISVETDYSYEPDKRPKWIEVYFYCASELNCHLDFIVHGDGERNMTLWAEDSEGLNIDSEIFTDPAKVEDALKTLEAKVKVPAKKEPSTDSPAKKEQLTDHERIERLERIVEPMERAIKTIQEEIAELKNR